MLSHYTWERKTRSPEVGRQWLSQLQSQGGLFFFPPFCLQGEKKMTHVAELLKPLLFGVSFLKHSLPHLAFAIQQPAAVHAHICVRWKMHARRLACRTVFLIAAWCCTEHLPFATGSSGIVKQEARSPCHQCTVYFMQLAGTTSPTSMVSLKCFATPLGCMVNGNSGSSRNAVRHLSWNSDYWEGCTKPSFLKHRRSSTENAAHFLVLYSKPPLVSTLAESSGICQKHTDPAQAFSCQLALLFLVHLCSFFFFPPQQYPWKQHSAQSLQCGAVQTLRNALPALFLERWDKFNVSYNHFTWKIPLNRAFPQRFDTAVATLATFV